MQTSTAQAIERPVLERNADEPLFTLNDIERQRCEIWTRVMGYHRPVTSFNPGKQSEHRERRHFVEAPRD